MARKKRTFSTEFRAEVVKLVMTGSLSCSDVAKRHELSPSLVAQWVRKAKVEAGDNWKNSMTSTERQELATLRRRVREAERENAFLKKCSAFFARSSA